ncbi:MAG: glycosyltransferase [Pseudomonadota bacterium]|nr:glycosyltransferase [Pseudomonadota bacterium]
MLSLVVPVYSNEGSIPDLLNAVASLARDINAPFETVFVVDGSPDRCYEILAAQLPSCTFSSQLVLLSRNFGSFAAIRAGMQTARGETFAVMAADLQEPPELVHTMWRILHSGDADVVVGVRNSRHDPWMSRLFSGLFWRLYRRYVVPDVPPGGVDVFACNKPFRDELLKLEERHSSLIAQVFWLGYRRQFVEYERRVRQHGASAWTFRKKLGYMMDSIFAFTDLPIRVLIRGGGIVAVLSGAFAIVIVLSRLAGLITVQGYAVTILAIVFFGALNLFGLGLVGSYAWRAYENTKARPLHVVLRRHIWQAERH